MQPTILSLVNAGLTLWRASTPFHAGTADSLQDRVVLRDILRKSLEGRFFILFVTLSSVSIHNLMEYTNRLISEKNQCWQDPQSRRLSDVLTWYGVEARHGVKPAFTSDRIYFPLQPA